MVNTTQQPAAATGGGANATATVATAFRSQTQPTIKRPGVALSAALTTAPVPLPDTQIPPTTLLRCIYLECSLAWNSSNAASVAYNADAPANFFSSVNFHDAQGTSIVGAFDSFTLSMGQKWFGFVNNADPMQSAVYKASTGTGAGSITIVFRIPVEVVSRTGVGSQINTDTQSPLVLSLTLNSTTAIFSTAPTSADLGNASVIISYGGYWNQSGNPNTFATPSAVGTLNYINWTNYTALNGQQQFQLANIGLGNSVANILFVNRDTTSTARSDSDFPASLQVAYRGNVLGQWSQLLWKHLMSEAYGYGNPTLDAGLGTNAATTTGEASLNQGVYNVWFNQDFVNQPGQSLFYGLLNTAVGDSIEVTAQWAASSTLYEVINFLAIAQPGLSAIQGH